VDDDHQSTDDEEEELDGASYPYFLLLVFILISITFNR
jgi:hypothetical protein